MSQFRNLAFEGGGVKGIAYAGAIRVLEEKGILGDIRRFAGTSAGAITAALLAVGAKGNDIQEIVGRTKFKEFMDDKRGFVRDAIRLTQEYGWFQGESFCLWMKKQLKSFTNDENVTFKTLHDKFRDLFVIGSDLSERKETVFSAETTPTMPVWQAVRISMSIPLFFTAVEEKGRLYVDGGMTWNYPVDLFDDRKFAPAPNAIGRIDGTTYDADHIFNKETLGFRVDTADEIKEEINPSAVRPNKIDNFAEYAASLVGFLMETSGKVHLKTNDWHRTVYIDAKGIRTTEFELSDARAQTLVNSGLESTRKYFAWFDNPAEKPLNRVS